MVATDVTPEAEVNRLRHGFEEMKQSRHSGECKLANKDRRIQSTVLFFLFYRGASGIVQILVCELYCDSQWAVRIRRRLLTNAQDSLIDGMILEVRVSGQLLTTYRACHAMV